MTPADETNRPGLAALAYRAGTWSTFRETMLARLSNAHPALTNLTTRESDDPAIALLDAWAVVADVLTFYDERIANEGYLRTATERRSILELARLVGYKPRPGVASSVYVAFTLQKGYNVTIPAGTAAKNTPGPGQAPQTFETGQSIEARSSWNQILPRPTRPQDIKNVASLIDIWFDGTSTRLKPNDKLLFAFGDAEGRQALRSIASVDEDHANKRTHVTLQVEPFSAAAFLLALDKLIPKRLALCPELATILNKYLPGGDPTKKPADDSERKKPLVDLDKDLDADIQTLVAKGSQNQDSKKNLQTLATAAAEIRQSLEAYLSSPLSPVAKRFAGMGNVWERQENHASAVSGYLDTIAFGATLSLQIRALISAEPKVGNEIEGTADFNALANGIAALRTGMRAKLLDLAGSFSSACATVSADLLAAAAIHVVDPNDQALINTITALQPACADGAARGTADEKAGAIEAVGAALHGATVHDATLQAKVAAILADSDAALAHGQAQIDFITGAELHVTGAEQTPIDSVHDAVQPLPGQLDGEPLRQQQQDIVAALTTISQAVTGAAAFPILKGRLQELIQAFAKAVGTEANTGIDGRINAHPIPVFPNVPEQTHSQKLHQIFTGITGEPDVLKHIGLADAALPLLDLELEAIQNDIAHSGGDTGCSKDAGAELQPVRDKFRFLWVNYIKALETLYAKRIPPPPEVLDQYKQARATLTALELMIRDISSGTPKSLAEMVTLGAALVKGMTDQPTASEKTWFDDLKRDLNDEIAKATAAAGPDSVAAPEQDAFGRLGNIAFNLGKSPVQSAKTVLTLADSFKTGSDTVARSLVALNPSLGTNLYDGWRSQKVGGAQAEVFALRVHGSLFGSNAPFPLVTKVTHGATDVIVAGPALADLSPAEAPDVIHLDTANDQILPDSWVVLMTRLTALPFFAKTVNPSVVSLAQYGISGKSTEIPISAPWFQGKIGDFSIIRTASVYALSEKLTLSEIPIAQPVGNAKGVDSSSLELDGYYDGIVPGRSVVVSGERLDVPGVVVSELAEIAAVKQKIDENLPGDTLHTTLALASSLQYGYKRSTVKINANVAPATNGETQKEVLGSGDGSQTFQTFKIRHLPLTWISQPTPSGAQSTLQVRVNDVLWHEADNLAFPGSSDRAYAINIEDDGTTTVSFGDGIHGLRVPTGTENVRARYRSGIGQPGNVPAGQIGILPSPPLGVTAVNNPAPATGGADAETRDQARRNVPIAVRALDRLVSVRDYADFARTYAGIAKASANRPGGTVNVVVAGLNDIPISPASDLFLNLEKSMKDFGDPHQPFSLDIRKLKLLAMSAEIAVDPDYDPDLVKAGVTTALLESVSFDARELGQDALLSEVISIMQAVAGVVYINVGQFGFIPETLDPTEVIDKVAAIQGAPPRIPVGRGEIAYFSRYLPETLVLNAITPEAGQ